MKNKKHLQRVAELPCCVCGMEPVQAHHLVGRDMKGMGQKSSDMFAIPLCPWHHSELHNIGWREWEQRHGSQLDYAAQTLNGMMYG